MDLLTLLSSLAWPSTVIILACLFRKPLSKVIESIRLQRIKRGDLEIDFGYELGKIKDQIDENKEIPKETKKILIDQIPSLSLEEQLHSITKINPAAAVALAWSVLEKEILAAIMRLAISPDYPAYNSAHRNIQLLCHQKHINKETFQILENLRRLRNEAVHAMNASPITVDEAEQYAKIVMRMLPTLRDLKR